VLVVLRLDEDCSDDMDDDVQVVCLDLDIKSSVSVVNVQSCQGGKLALNVHCAPRDMHRMRM